MIRKIWVLAALLLAVPVAASAQWEEGVHYQKLSSPLDTLYEDQYEVAEVFWYGCPACHQMQPVIERWKETKADDVALRHVPAPLRADWRPHAQAYYVAQELDILEEVHQALFDALAGERRNLSSRDSIAAFFAAETDVDEQAARDAWDSFSVDAAMRRGRQFVQGAGVTGTPSVVVEGKYMISVRGAGSFENMLAIADYLVEQERASD